MSSEIVIAPKKAIKVRVGEMAYEVRKPSNRELHAFSTREKNDATALADMIKFLASLGLPEEVSWELDPESVTQIVESLVPQKKS